MIKSQILIIDDDADFCYTLSEQLSDKGFKTETSLSMDTVFQKLNQSIFDLVLLDLGLPGENGVEILQEIKSTFPSIEVVILTGQNDTKQAVECMRLGAADYILKPYLIDELLLVFKRVLEHKELVLKNEILEKRSEQKFQSRIIGQSEQVTKLLSLSEKIAASESNLLIEGETGTGKELIAEFIHRNSQRANKPFVVINCASLPDQLIESELFGYEKGSFTDAKTSKQGLAEIANGGTLFLDEIGEMSLAIQPKLLRFLENGEFRRIGGLTTLHSDVRIIGATNRNLLEEAEKKNFRNDLLFRINVITLIIPPLRDRRDDIILLAEHFIKQKSPIRSPKSLSKDAINALVNYKFPGNVRELEHIIERAIIFSDSNIIHSANLYLPNINASQNNTDLKDRPDAGSNNSLSIEDLERQHILNVLDANGWEQNKSATVLGISLKTLYNKIKKFNLKQN